jgi:hypothetical protein
LTGWQAVQDVLGATGTGLPEEGRQRLQRIEGFFQATTLALPKDSPHA